MAPKVKIGPGEAGGQRPRCRRSAQEIAERSADGAEQPGDRDRRVVERTCRTDVRVRGDEVLLGCQDVRPAREQRRREVGRNCRRRELVNGLAARDGTRVASEQDRDEIFLCGDLLTDGGDRGQRLHVLRLDLRDLRHRHDALLEAAIEDPRRLAEVRGRGARDLELAVEGAHHDVRRRDTRHHREHDAALRLLARVDLRLRGFRQAAHAAEEVELPRRTERSLVQREVRIDGLRNRREAEAARARARHVTTVTDLRIELRARRLQRAGELVDARGGDAHVAVLLQRGLDEVVQHRVAELLPPLRVRDVDGLRIVDPPRVRRVHAGTSVVRADGAACKGERYDGDEHTSLHPALLPILRRIFAAIAPVPKS